MAPQSQNVTIIAPDGTSGDVPSANVNAALAAGGKLGIHVYAPDGTAGYVPHDKLGDALKAGATYAPAQQSNPDQPKGFTASLVAPIPALAKGLYHSFVDSPRDPNEQRVKGTDDQSGVMMRGLGQFGLGAYRTLVAPAVANAHAAAADAQSPNLSNRLAATSEAIGAIPVIGGGIDAGKSVLQQYLSGDKSGAAGSVAGNLVTAGLMGAVGGELGAPAVDGTLTPLERSAVGVTKAVNPQGVAFRQYRQAVADQGVNVLDFAKKNNLPITDSRDFAKVAKMAADETQNHYSNNVLGPHADTQVPIQGVNTDLGSNASLGDINERVNNITQDLRAGQRKATPGQQASALSGDDIRGMQAEQGGLTDILHRSLGDLNQMDPRDIASLRQRAGQMRTIAGETEGASDALSGSAGKAEVGAGPGLPTNAHGAVQALIARLPGMNPESVASRKLIKALTSMRDLPEAPRGGLPAAYPQNEIPPSVADQINLQAQQQRAQDAFLHTHALDQAAQDAAQSRNVMGNVMRRGNVDTQRTIANQEFLRSNQLEQGAQDASASRSGIADVLRRQRQDIQAEALKNQLLNNGQQVR